MFSTRILKMATVSIATLGLLASTAMAKPSAPVASTKIKIERSVKKLPFGKGVKATLKWIGKRMRGTSPGYVKAELKRIKKAMVKFTPSADVTAYKKSIVANEFQVGNGEAMLRWNDGRREHYFFFHNAKLYKYAKPVSVPPTTLGFVDRVNLLSKDLGAPTGTFSPGGNDEVVEARWVKNKVETRILDKRTQFMADMLVVEHFKLCRKVEAARKGHGTGTKTYAVDPSLKEFLE